VIPTYPDDMTWAARRAAESAERSGLTATFLPAAQVFTVPSRTMPGAAHQVTAEARSDALVWLSCSCPAGKYRPDAPVPCAHAAAAGAELARLMPLVYRSQNMLYYVRKEDR
jgi:hypothetical protein